MASAASAIAGFRRLEGAAAAPLLLLLLPLHAAFRRASALILTAATVAVWANMQFCLNKRVQISFPAHVSSPQQPADSAATVHSFDSRCTTASQNGQSTSTQSD